VFGPYASARSVRETLRHLKRWFPLRTCSDAELRQRTRPCIEHEMGRCVAPCVDLVTPAEYDEVVQEVLLFLRGKNETLLPRLRARMQAHSDALRYEQAARIRDQIRAIERTLEGQRVSREGGEDQDVFGLADAEGLVVVLVVPVREGQVTAPQAYELRTVLGAAEALNAFLAQYYGPARYVPREVLLPCEVPDQDLLGEVLSERKGSTVRLRSSVRGDRRQLLELARKNAALQLATGEEKRRVTAEALDGLRLRLDLETAPRTIECYDVSTIQGAFTVASRVTFEDGEPDPSRYRTYKVRGVEGQDDFAAMEEVIGRRLAGALERGDLPDLLVVDGGPPQLARALLAARAAGIPEGRLTLVGLAKARRTEDAESPRAFERVWIPGRAEAVLLEPASLECRLLARIRDAAHRTAIRYHRELRRKSALRSGLEEVPGVGPKRRSQLLKRFGSLKGIRAASQEELEQVLPVAVARALREFLEADG
jgi:excinuclease ABC subunit C